MNSEQIRTYCLSKKAVSEDFPFDEDVLVFKVKGKIFLLMSLASSESVNLKCDPEQAVEWREQFDEVIPGFHMNKKHWNTVSIVGKLGKRQIEEMIDHSYAQVVKGLPKKEREGLE